MSKGYVSKKRAKAKKQRRLRKKYHNFSCDTCVKAHNFACLKRYQPIRYGSCVVTRYEFCPEWKADKPAQNFLKLHKKVRKFFSKK